MSITFINIAHIAPGYKKTHDNLNLEGGKAGTVETNKRLSQKRIGGWWAVLRVPAVAGLSTVWGTEKICQGHGESSAVQDRLLVALFNGLVGADVLVLV